MDGREWAASRFAGNVRFERRTTTGTEPSHPQAASFYFRDPAAFRLALTFSFAFSKQKTDPHCYRALNRALKAISSASHSPIQRDPNYLNADNYLKLSLHVHVRHRAFTRPYSFRVARFYLPPTFTLETSIFCSKESAVLAGFTEPGVHRPLASYPRIYI